MSHFPRLPIMLGLGILAALAIALWLGGATGQRTLATGNEVDGLVTPGEYANSVATDVVVNGSDVVSGAATVHYDADAENLYVAVEYTSLDLGPDDVLETTDDPVINENVFGPNSYLGGTNNTGWPSHKFHQLLGSDALEITLDCAGTQGTDFNWVQDYLDDPEAGVWESPSGTSPGDAGVSASGPVPAGISSASSLEWNLEQPSSFDLTHGSTDNKDWTSPNFSPAYPTPAAEAGDFEFAMIYEFSLSLSNISDCTEVQLGFPSVHNSPTKRGFKDTHGQDIEIPPLSLEPTITLEPPTETNTVGDDHTVTATVDLLGNPLPDVLVTFAVTSGPNAGSTGTCSLNADCTTDANGQVSFTYTGDGAAGGDTIQACFTFVPTEPQREGNDTDTVRAVVETEICAQASKVWQAPTATPTPTPTPPPSATSTPTPTPPPTQAVLEAAALPNLGGEPPDGGSSGLLPGRTGWLAVIAGMMAVTASGGLWLAYQRKRVR